MKIECTKDRLCGQRTRQSMILVSHPFQSQDRGYEMVSCLTEAAAPIKLIPARAPQERVYS